MIDHPSTAGALVDAEVQRIAAADAAGLPNDHSSAVLEQLAEGVIVTDVEGQIIFVNRAAVRQHGVKELQVEPEDYSNIYHLFTVDGDPYPPTELPLARAVMRGEIVEDERWRIRRPDGSEILAIGSARPLLDDNGLQVGAVLTIRDDTARHDAEKKLAELNRTLENRVADAVAKRELVEAELRQAQKMEAVGQLTGGVAHDFNNLLTIIVGSLELLEHCKDRPEKRDRHLANIGEAANKAATLTQKLLAFSRRQPLEPKSTDIGALIADMSDLLKRTIGAEITLETELASDLPKATIDTNQLENVLLNLAANSRDAMAQGGLLKIETYRSDPPGERLHDVAAHIAVSVTDSGKGIEPDIIGQVFEPFFTTKSVGKGSGLGLSMAYGFIKQSGGDIAIRSTPGKGTTVTLYLLAD